jgi:putative heme degradation protein
MTGTDLPPRQELTAAPAEVGLLVPALGRVMVALSVGGATHERIGRVAHVARRGSRLGLGDETELDLAAVRRVVLDRGLRMRGQAYPRLEFQDRKGRVVLRVVGMEGEAPFETPLSHLLGPALFPEQEAADPFAAPEVAPEGPDEPAAALLGRLHAARARVRVALCAGPAMQSWEGMLPEPRLAMGHVNLIEPGFHLHLRTGAVASFRGSETGWEALDATGAPLGLTLLPRDDVPRRAREAGA